LICGVFTLWPTCVLRLHVCRPLEQISYGCENISLHTARSPHGIEKIHSTNRVARDHCSSNLNAWTRCHHSKARTVTFSQSFEICSITPWQCAGPSTLWLRTHTQDQKVHIVVHNLATQSQIFHAQQGQEGGRLEVYVPRPNGSKVGFSLVKLV
jgi:hypothetical protein